MVEKENNLMGVEFIIGLGVLRSVVSIGAILFYWGLLGELSLGSYLRVLFIPIGGLIMFWALYPVISVFVKWNRYRKDENLKKKTIEYAEWLRR